MKVKWLFEKAEWRQSYDDAVLFIDFSIKGLSDDSYQFIEESLTSLNAGWEGITITSIEHSANINYMEIQQNGERIHLPVYNQRTPIKFSAKFQIGRYRNIRDIMDALINFLLESFAARYGGAIYSVEMPIEMDPETFFGIHVLETSSEEQSEGFTATVEEVDDSTARRALSTWTGPIEEYTKLDKDPNTLYIITGEPS